MAKVVVGGFSQGSMLAMDVALSLPENCAGVAAFSSFPIVVEQWALKCKPAPGKTTTRTLAP